MGAKRPNPLAEVFGFPPDNHSPAAQRYRRFRLCPYNNKVPSCTKDRANDPLGVCSIWHGDEIAITCPIRFREQWLIAEDAADFFFGKEQQWTSLTEVRLNDAEGKSAGNIDIVLVAYDERGRITDFGALEVQAVYISGNVRRLFERYMGDPDQLDWSQARHYPRPDYLSSSRKRLVPQLLYKGAILQGWGKKIAVAIHTAFYKTLPPMPEVARDEAEVAWLLYDLILDPQENRFHLTHARTIYTRFHPSLNRLITPQAGPVEHFLDRLQNKLDALLEEQNPPDAPTLADLRST